MSIPKFHTLRIRDLRREAPDAISLAFDIPADLVKDYAFEPGQYLTLRTTLDGEDLRRSYSICSGPADGELRIGVKKVEGGPFSTWLNADVKPGDDIAVMTPTGRFGIASASDSARVYAGFAAGSGITPLLSILRGILHREPHSRFFLFYGNRGASGIMFREALDDLKDKYLGRLSVFHVLSQEEQDLPVLNGRLDREKVALLLRHLVPASAIDHAFICGPTGMSESVEGALRDAGLAPEQIHVERFVSAEGGRPKQRAAVVKPAAAEPSCRATLIVDGNRRDVPIAEGETVLDAALVAGLDLPFACKGGMCCTCRAKLVEGTATMDVNYSLQPWEIEAGFILTCQARPQTARIVLDYDAM
jgi:ring-1,2-phenylacetyl-CoA epoxidase subunit PaaE